MQSCKSLYFEGNLEDFAKAGTAIQAAQFTLLRSVTTESLSPSRPLSI